MAGKHTFIVMVQVETDDPRLSEEAMTRLPSATAGEVASTRRAILSRLPHEVTRLIAVLPLDQARLLMRLHEAVGQDLGGPAYVRPPSDYVPPTHD